MIHANIIEYNNLIIFNSLKFIWDFWRISKNKNYVNGRNNASNAPVEWHFGIVNVTSSVQKIGLGFFMTPLKHLCTTQIPIHWY